MTQLSTDVLNKEGKCPTDVFRDVAAYLRDDDVLVFHNSSYDWDTVLKTHAESWCNDLVTRGILVTFSCQGPLLYSSEAKKSPSLTELCLRFGVSIDNNHHERLHSSSYDAQLLARCVQKAMSFGICV